MGVRKSFGGKNEKCKLRNREVLEPFWGMSKVGKGDKMIFKNLCEL